MALEAVVVHSANWIVSDYLSCPKAAFCKTTYVASLVIFLLQRHYPLTIDDVVACELWLRVAYGAYLEPSSQVKLRQALGPPGGGQLLPMSASSLR